MWILRVNMTDRTYSLSEVPEAYKNLGGRGMTSTIVCDEFSPLCHPLGPNNKLVFAPGIVTGTSSPTSARISVGAKSPLTGGIKEANAGSTFPPALASMGVRALVVEGKPKDKGWWMAHVTWNQAPGAAQAGGLGAVMGSKGLKFIILDRKGAPGVHIENKEVFEQGRKKLTDALMTHDI